MLNFMHTLGALLCKYFYLFIYIHKASSQDSAPRVNIKMKEFF